MKKYPTYKDSGIEWLGEIPIEWEIKRLKYTANLLVSNVDKKKYDYEVHVRLCNYSDVYNNDVIVDSLDFMQGSVTNQELDRFKLYAGDVIITKDSETPDDIAVPAYVPNSYDDVVCGYHLSIIRHDDFMLGKYIYYLFKSYQFNQQFTVAARGITRFGLSQASISNSFISIPSLEEQAQIAQYLDQKTQQIDDLISKKEKLIDLLKEERTAIINQAVTKGLDPDVPMRYSGIEWLGEIPEHWSIVKLSLVNKIKDGTHDTPKPIENNSDKSYPLITSKNIKYNTIDFNDVYNISEFDHENIKKRSEVNFNDIIMPMIGTVGNPVIVKTDLEFSIKNLALFKYSEEVHNVFLCYFLDSWVTKTQFDLLQRGGVQNFVSLEILRSLRFIYPPIEEQIYIAQYLDHKTQQIDDSICRIEHEIELIKEYKISLINKTVTGKVDVRNHELY